MPKGVKSFRLLIYKINEVLLPFNRRINCMANFCLPSKNFFETKKIPSKKGTNTFL